MILLVGGEKGGTGKSTLATNMAVHLARAGRDVLLLDSDRQGTASSWTAERTEHQEELPQVICVQRNGNLFQTVKDLAKRYQEVIIDAGGRDSEELRSAMVVANKFYSPFRPSQGDLWTAEHLASLVTMARGLNPSLEAYAILTLAPTNPRIQEIQEASAMLTRFEQIKLSKITVHDRKVYRDAMFEGRGVMEMTDPKACEEIRDLANEIYGVGVAHARVQEQNQAC